MGEGFFYRELDLTIAGVAASMSAGITLNEIKDGLAALWWRPGSGMQNPQVQEKGRAIFYDIFEVTHKRPILGEGWVQAWRECPEVPPARPTAAAASSSSPATRRPAQPLAGPANKNQRGSGSGSNAAAPGATEPPWRRVPKGGCAFLVKPSYITQGSAGPAVKEEEPPSPIKDEPSPAKVEPLAAKKKEEKQKKKKEEKKKKKKKKKEEEDEEEEEEEEEEHSPPSKTPS